MMIVMALALSGCARDRLPDFESYSPELSGYEGKSY
jgi:hypothetical protein